MSVFMPVATDYTAQNPIFVWLGAAKEPSLITPSRINSGQLQPVVADEQPQPVVYDGQPHPVVAEGQLQENLPVEDPFSQEIPKMGVQAENSQTLEVNPIEVTALD
ncbi:hypothetical protein M422DRAFT_243665 [Sphaerobolus stellatus SS14]|nr:hypothetical protein M422DRAFT_243665 [Sphaerobolus stellatus SS14]